VAGQVPLIGDPTSASQRAADPAGWALDPAVRDGLHQVIGARRDVRRFRPDAVPADVLAEDVGARSPQSGCPSRAPRPRFPSTAVTMWSKAG
jgi:hypothetical protein